MKRIAFILKNILACLTLVACSSAAITEIDDRQVSLRAIQVAVVASLPLGLRDQSANRRTFFSEYFAVTKGEFKSAKESKERRYAQVEVLGDRRPYTINVVVYVEELSSSQNYSSSGYDKGLARVVLRRIEKTIRTNAEERNLIDDFRPF